MIRTFIGALVALISIPVMAITANAQGRSIDKVAGDVYRFKDEYHYSLVTVTDAGVVVVDPINLTAATWLRKNLKQITDKPITHLIYSHSHDDHATGGQALKAKTIIAHANAPERIYGVKPTHRFKEAMTFEMGGKTFELTWLGVGHGKDLIAVVVRPENVGFIVDAASKDQPPYEDFPDTDIDGLIRQIQKVETLDFEIFAGGHNAIGVKGDVTEIRVYIEELRAEVLKGLKAGKSTDELVKSVKMEKYKYWGWYYDNWRPMNVRGMARYLKAIGAVN